MTKKCASRVFSIARPQKCGSWARKANDLQLVFGGIPGKSTPPFAHSAEAFTAAAIAVPGTDDDADSYRLGVRLRPMNKLSQFRHIVYFSG